MNEDAVSAMLTLLKQAQSATADAPEHFVFPACGAGSIDPTKPQKSWRTAWRTLTRGITCRCCGEFQNPSKTCRNEACRADITGITSGTAGLRFHDLRHTAITILAESSASEQTVMAIAGHVSRRMLEHYSHIRMDAKRRAVASLIAPRSLPTPGTPVSGELAEAYDTIHGTNGNSQDTAALQAIEKIGGPGLT